MKRLQLDELVGSVVARHPAIRLIIAGSQALYARFGSAPEVVEQSLEADLLLTGDSFKARRQIEEEFGMGSPYQGSTGLYAHPVGLGTVVLPGGWEERLIPFGRDHGWQNVWALEIHDLAATKLIAGRGKDYAFVVEMLRHEGVRADLLLPRFLSFRASSVANAVDDRLQNLVDRLDAEGLRSLAQKVRAELQKP
jgi:hypothetical protein